MTENDSGRGPATWIPAICGVLALAVVADPALGQRSREGDDPVVRIRDLEGNKIRSPKYSSNYDSNTGRKAWYEIKAEYEVEDDWLDGLTFTFYVLFKPDTKAAAIDLDPRKPYLLMRGAVTYNNVAEGKHLATMFVHPSTLSRFGDVLRVAVVASHGGAMQHFLSKPDGKQGWWDNLPPQDGQVLAPADTPYGVLLTDDYPMTAPPPPKKR